MARPSLAHTGLTPGVTELILHPAVDSSELRAYNPEIHDPPVRTTMCSKLSIF